jgi:CRP-like cAMP-binding protein
MRCFERLGRLSAAERAHLDWLTADSHLIGPRRKLIDDGRPCRQMFIVKSGWLAEYKQLPDGGRQILNFRLPGEVVGIECLVHDAALHATAAVTVCTVARLPRETFERTQREHPRLATALLMMTLRDRAILNAWAVNLGRRTGYARVAHLLLELAERLQIRGLAAGATMPFPLTQQDIADCTGLTAPYVNQILQRMRQTGLLRFGAEQLEIRNAAALAKAAGFRPDYLQAWPRLPDLAPRPPERPARPAADPDYRLADGQDLARA